MNRVFWLGIALAVLSGCTTFVPVRSGEVREGAGLELAVAATTPPGDEAAWFFGLYCSSSCNRPITGLSLAARVGMVPDAGRPFEVGLGWSGVFPYAEGFVQVTRTPRPVGAGARLGLSRGAWYEDVLFLAYDIDASPGYRLFATTSFFRHAGRTPNGDITGSLVALGQGIGADWNGIATSAALVVGRTERDSYGARVTSPTAFLVFAISGLLGY